MGKIENNTRSAAHRKEATGAAQLAFPPVLVVLRAQRTHIILIVALVKAQQAIEK